MAANAYIQSALAQLQSAVSDIQGQMQGLQRDIDQEKKGLDGDIKKFARERKLHEVTVANIDPDHTTERHTLMDRIQHLGHESDDRKKQMAQLDSELQSVLQRKTQVYNRLTNLMSQLNQFLASPDIR